MRENRSGVKRCQAEIVRRLENKTAALLVVRAVGRVCGLAGGQLPALRSRAPRSKRGELAAAVARASALGEAVGMPIEIPSGWKKRLIDDVSAPDVVWKAPHLRSLVEAALTAGEDEVAYAASGIGLAQGGAERAHFLLLRARSLPPWATYRRHACLMAAIELARRQRDMELVSEAVEVGRTDLGFGISPWFDPLAPGEGPASSDELEAILRGEIEAREFPEVPQELWGEDDEDDFNLFCQCPECRRRRGESHAFGEDDEDELFDEGPVFLPPELAGIPPKVLSIMLEAIARYGGPDREIPEPEEIAARDPELYRRLEEALIEQQIGSDVEVPGFRSPRRKRGGKRKKRGKR